MQSVSPKQHYSERVSSLDSRIQIHRRRNRLFVAGEIVTFVLFIAFIAAYAQYGWGWTAVWAAMLSLVAYFVIRRMDENNEARTEWLVDLRDVCMREQAYLLGDFSPFDDGVRYIDYSHPFTADLDIFGPQSLFNRVNRTVTSGGSDRLAALLSSQPLRQSSDHAASASVADSGLSPIERISQRAEAIRVLSGRVEWRTEFCAVGARGQINTVDVARAMHAVRDVNVASWVLSPVSVALAMFGCVGLMATVVLAAADVVPSNVAVIWALVQLGAVLGLCHAKLMEISRAVGKLQRQMAAYVKLVRMISEWSVESGRAEENLATPVESKLLCQLAVAVGGASESFREVGKMLAGLDRRSNILGLIFSDIFVLSDFRLLHRFAVWQRRYVLDMDRWIEAVGEADALVSMATFRYNEPRGVDAEIVDCSDVLFDAKALCHPFLGHKAVPNDFTVNERNYYIVTGANMAGKSTFLRSLGINWLLAMNGMPVFAERLRLSVFPLFTSMRTTDDLTRGISYFNAELLRLKSLIDFCAEYDHVFIILDEILKGTNSADKLGGSRMFLEYMSRRSVTGVIATHDLELSRLADDQPDRFHNWCFEIELGTDVTYTYRIEPGVARNQNATFLLRQIIGQ